MLLLITIGLLLWKKWFLSGLLIIAIVVLNWWGECILFLLWSVNDIGDIPAIKVMSFNISGTSKDIHPKASALVSLIKRNASDIIFITKISNKNKPILGSLMLTIYSYTAFTDGYAHCFYSKGELKGWRKLENDSAEKLWVYTCVLPVNGDSITLYVCHFASNNYNAKQQYITPDNINSHKELKTYMIDVKRAYRLRTEEANILAEEVKSSKHPVLVMGDMDDVGGSVAIKALESAVLRDDWWQGGSSYGATINYPLPYRKDNIMYSEGLRPMMIKVVESDGLSDHDAL